uniref:D-alanine--D-alanine ligase N-terminal domain-containing protein n=1 Tax=Fagus sylvatica TaxID=28930 RepID=A0A2N9JBR4_FAGSY
MHPLLSLPRATAQSEGTGREMIFMLAAITLIEISMRMQYLQLSLAQGFQSLSEFAEHLAASVDIVFPVIHGRFGEDGGIQELLEEYNIPFVGTGSNECRQAFDKGNERNESELSKWFARNQLDPNSGKVVVKPARAGSRIGVKVAYGGSEFTAIVLDVGSGLDCHPVVLLPTEDMSEKVEK